MLIILTGKTASGKDTIANSLLAHMPNLKRVVTTTTRLPRTKEHNGVDYYFLTESEFNQKKAEGNFIEFVSYGGNFYGTTKDELNNLDHTDLLWRIDPSRAARIRELISGNITVIYITVSDSVITARLKNRGLSKTEIDQRMKQDANDWTQYKNNYDYVVENVPGQLDETVNKVYQIIKSKT